jgi:hypothetical protein
VSPSGQRADGEILTRRRFRTVLFARVVRYEVGQAENAGQFIHEVREQFDTMPDDLEGLAGAFLLARPEEGEALEITLWERPEDVATADPVLLERAAPDTGAREVVTGRRADETASALWAVFQGKVALKTG